MSRVLSNFHAVKQDMARSLSHLKVLQSVAYVDDNTPIAKDLYPYSAKELVGKKHGEVKIRSNADFDRLVVHLY